MNANLPFAEPLYINQFQFMVEEPESLIRILMAFPYEKEVPNAGSIFSKVVINF